MRVQLAHGVAYSKPVGGGVALTIAVTVAVARGIAYEVAVSSSQRVTITRAVVVIKVANARIERDGVRLPVAFGIRLGLARVIAVASVRAWHGQDACRKKRNQRAFQRRRN
jgi:hypothetical protein